MFPVEFFIPLLADACSCVGCLLLCWLPVQCFGTHHTGSQHRSKQPTQAVASARSRPNVQLGTLSNDAPSATSSNFPSENGSEIQHDPFTISQPTHISKALQDAVPPTVGNLPLESASIYDDYLQPNVASIVTDQVVTFACLVWGVAFTALIWHMCMTKWFRKKPHGTQVRKDFETEDSMTKLKSNDMDSDCGYPPSPHTWPLQGKSHQL